MVKICLLLLKHAEGIGLYPVEPNESIFNRRNIGVLCIFGQTYISVTAYLVFGATTMRKFEECFFLWITLSATITGFFGSILKTRTMFQLLEHANSFIDRRKYTNVDENRIINLSRHLII